MGETKPSYNSGGHLQDVLEWASYAQIPNAVWKWGSLPNCQKKRERNSRHACHSIVISKLCKASNIFKYQCLSVPYFTTHPHTIKAFGKGWSQPVAAGRARPHSPSSVQLRVFTLRFSNVFQILSPAANDQMIPRCWRIYPLPTGNMQKKTTKDRYFQHM